MLYQYQWIFFILGKRCIYNTPIGHIEYAQYSRFSQEFTVSSVGRFKTYIFIYMYSKSVFNQFFILKIRYKNCENINIDVNIYTVDVGILSKCFRVSQ